jgi:hypothetical protein
VEPKPRGLIRSTQSFKAGQHCLSGLFLLPTAGFETEVELGCLQLELRGGFASRLNGEAAMQTVGRPLPQSVTKTMPHGLMQKTARLI